MLTIRNLCKSYSSESKNDVKALNNINLDINSGMFGLLGPNGAGKSSLMRTIATLQQPDSGQILFNGHDVLTQPENIRPVLGYLPQEFGVYPGMSAFSLLEHFALLKGLSNKQQRREQIEALLALTNLTKVKNKAVSGFSGGMKQRFGIAQALLGSPKLLIVDEPTAGLDPEERNRFHNLLSDISENTVVILSTHIVEDVSNLCPNMAIQVQGEIIASGAPSELTATLSNTLWQATINKAQLAEYQQRHQVISHRLVAGKVQIHVVNPICPTAEFSPVTPDLEDVYFFLLAKHNLKSEQKKLNLEPIISKVKDQEYSEVV
jgi:ABC-type multidrug transport system ATPase subunit